MSGSGEVLQQRLAALDEQRRTAEDLASQRKRENDDLQDELKRLRTALNERQQVSRELESQVTRLETDRAVERIELHKVKQEFIYLKEHSSKVEEDYKRSLKESQEEWKACMERLTKCEKDLSRVQIEKNAVEARAKLAEGEVQRLQQRLSEAHDGQVKLQADLLAIERDRDRELATCKTLVARCKDVEDEANREKQRAMDLVAEAQHRMRKAEEAFAEERVRMEADFKQRLNEMTARKLDLDISHAVVASLSPTAAEDMLRNRGLTLTALYTELVDEKEHTRQTEEEVVRLQAYLEKIVAEVERTAPELVSARMEYNRILANCDVLNEKLAELFNDNASLKEDLAERSAIADRLTKENHELVLQAEDLSSQVRALLSHSEANVSFASPPRAGRAEDDPQTAISQNLVQYSNVQQLQERNQQLLRLVRRLAEDSERASADGDLAEKLAEAEEEVKRMCEARERQEAMVAAIVRQRDLYRSLLHQADGKFAEQSRVESSLVGVSSPTTTNLTVGSVSSENLRSEFDLYRREMQEQVKQQSAQLEETRNQLHEARLRLGGSEAARVALEDRLKYVTEMMETARKDADRAREAEVAASAQIAQVRATLDERRRLLDEADRNHRALEQERDMARAEAKVLRDQTEEMKEVQHQLMSQRDSQRALAEQWERALRELTERYASIGMERDRATKHAQDAANEAARARADRDDMAAKLEQERLEWANKVSDISRQLQDAKEQLAALSAEVEVLRRNEATLKDQLDRAISTPRPVTVGGAPQSSASSSFGVAEDLRLENDKLKRLLEQKAKDLEAIRAVASASDEAVRTLQSALEKTTTEADARVKQLQAAVVEAERAVAAKDRAMVEERERMEATLTNAKAALHVAGEVESLRLRLQGAEDDVKRLQKEASAAAENYSRELQAHAADVASLSDLRRDLEKAQSELEAKVKQARDAEARLVAKQNEWLAEQKVLEARLNEDKRIIEDLNKERRLLGEQLQRVTASTLSSSSTLAGESADVELLEMLAIANRARDQLALEKETLQMDLQRAQSQLIHARTEAERLRSDVRRMEAQLASGQDKQKLLSTQQELEILRGLDSSKTQELDRYRAEVDRLRIELSAARDRQSLAAQSESQARSKQQMAEAELATKEKELSIVKERLQSLRDRLGDAEALENLKTEKEKLDATLIQIRQASERLKNDLVKKLAAAESEAADAKLKLAQADNKLKELTAQVSKLQALSQKVTSLEAELQDQKQLIERKNEVIQKKDVLMNKFRQELTERRAKDEKQPGDVVKVGGDTASSSAPAGNMVSSQTVVQDVAPTPPVATDAPTVAAASSKHETTVATPTIEPAAIEAVTEAEVPRAVESEAPLAEPKATPDVVPTVEQTEQGQEAQPMSSALKIETLPTTVIKRALINLKMQTVGNRADLIATLRQVMANNEQEVMTHVQAAMDDNAANLAKKNEEKEALLKQKQSLKSKTAAKQLGSNATTSAATTSGVASEAPPVPVPVTTTTSGQAITDEERAKRRRLERFGKETPQTAVGSEQAKRTKLEEDVKASEGSQVDNLATGEKQ